MTRWLLDTNVLSEPRKPKPDRSVMAWMASQSLESLFTSSVALAEIRFGIERVEDPGRRSELTDWLTHRLRPMFDRRVLPVSEDVLLRWRVIVESGRKTGHTFAHPDVFIAATAAQHGLTVVTRDVAGFDRTGVPVLNPWKPVVRAG